MVRPEGLEELVSETTPVNPPNGVIVIRELFEGPPAWTMRETGLAESEKPGPVTVNWISIMWKRELLVAVTSRV